MKEIKDPKKNWLYYYSLVLLVTMILNVFVLPRIQEASIKEVPYNVFMNLTEEKKISQVQIESNAIYFKEAGNDTLYKTGLINDPELTDRLYAAGVDFQTKIPRVSSPLETFFFSWILPILIFFLIGQFLSKRLINRMGGGNSMMFGMGKSNAKIYVQSTEGIRFHDVAGADEAK